MYCKINFKTKKLLKEAVQRGDRVTVFQPGPFLRGTDMGQGNEPDNGTVYLEGPHFPKPHTWYAEATVKNGIVVKVQ